MAATNRVMRREDLKPGDEVYVIVRYGRDGSQVKRKRARIVDVLRAAVVLDRIEGEAGPRTVRLNEIESLDSPPPPTVIVTRRRDAPPEPFVGDVAPTQSPTLKVVPPAFASVQMPKAKPPEEPRPAPPPPAASPLDAISAWMAQGASMLDQLTEARLVKQAEVAALEDEALQIQIEVEGKQKELAKLDQMIDALGKMQQIGGPA